MASQEATLRDLQAASNGFKLLLNDDVGGAKELFAGGDSPFHVLGSGVVHFLQAALGMEEGLMPDAVTSLTAAEAGAKAAAKATRSARGNLPSRYPVGMEHEICQADAIVLLGLTQALSESYMGYLQCMYSLNSAHGKFSKMYKQVFPHGLGSYGTPTQTPSISRNPSTNNLAASAPVTGLQTPASGTSSAASSIINGKTGHSTPVMGAMGGPKAGGLFGRWSGKASLQSTSSLASAPTENGIMVPEGPIEELIVAGAAFGFGLFNLVFSLLPNKVKKVVGFLGYQSDRRLGLEALNVAATVENDVHSSFAALVLMTYNGVILLLTGWQADEDRIVKQYQDILESVESKYPHGSLWLLNRAKLERMTLNPAKAIEILERGLSAERPVKFVQADALLLFELSWTLLASRKYKEAAESFLKIKELNSWSHATYTFIAAGCYLALATDDPEYKAKARALLDSIPQLLERKKIGGKDLPTEVFIQKKIDFYKRKQARRAGSERTNDYIDSIFICPAEELAIFWNTHCRITNDIAQAHISNLVALSPVISTVASEPLQAGKTGPPELDTADEIAVRDLLLGILYRAAGDYVLSRKYLEAVTSKEGDVEGKWTGQVSKFELAVLDLREVSKSSTNRDKWSTALKAAIAHLDQAAARSNASVDLSSRLDSRIALLRDEIEVKMQGLGLK